MSYNPRSGNPFTYCDPNNEWKTNGLILQDPKLRQRAGVSVLDHNVSEMFPCKELERVHVGQTGGRIVGAPTHLRNFGSKKVAAYDPAVQVQVGGVLVGAPIHRQNQSQNQSQSGGGYYPYRYFNSV